MTCNPRKNFLYTEFYKPWVNGTLPKHMKFVPALITDNIHADPASLVSMTSITDGEIRSRLYEGNWEYNDSEMALIESKAIQDLFSRNVSALVSPGNKYLSCDIASLGKDSTVVCQWDGLRIDKIHVWEKLTISERVKRIKSLAATHNIPVSRIVIDANGIGESDAQLLYGCVQFLNNGQPVDVNNRKVVFSNLKSQCYYKLAQLINNRQIFIDVDNIAMQESIREELEQVKASDPTNEGKLSVLKKKAVKKILGRSPDLSDSIMMRMWWELRPTLTTSPFGGAVRFGDGRIFSPTTTAERMASDFEKRQQERRDKISGKNIINLQ
jgi:hypothetical protein